MYRQINSFFQNNFGYFFLRQINYKQFVVLYFCQKVLDINTFKYYITY